MRRRFLIGVMIGLLGGLLSATTGFSAEKTTPISRTKQPLSCRTKADCVSLIDQCNVDVYCYPPLTRAGQCYTVPAPDKTPCEADKNLCTKDQCFSGVCSAASTKQCTPSQPCEEGKCDPATGDCSYVTKDPGASCADGNVCNGDEVCDAKANCLSGTPPNLDDGNPCTIDSCHPVSGIHHIPAGKFTSCADTNICDGEEMCGALDGICHPGTPLDPDDGDPFTLDTCEDNQIVHRPIPEVDATVAANFGNDTEFLYTGAAPYQKAVAPGTIDETRAAVLRGRVLTLDGSPLPGVKVQILDHDELGFAYTLGDGTFALAVNGGAELTVVYSMEGYLGAQRTVKTGWHDYYWASDLVMIRPDPNVTEVEFDTAKKEYQVVMGSEISDANGPRREVLLIAPGTRAEMVLPNGTLQPMSSLNVHITEYTEGDQGPAAMPAELPPTSQYTYAVEYYADEAIAAGSKHVFVDPPMISYNGNFLDFPVGTQIPMGSYSRTKGKWIPNDNGQVIGILSITGGLADIDLDGDSVAEDAPTLSRFGITEGERQKVAELFPNVPTSAWRALVPHFTDPWDKNMGGGPGPDDEPPKVPDPTGDDDDPNQCIEQGSIVSCPSQVLREEVPVAGTPFSLHYASNRVPGRKAGYTLEIPLSGSTLAPHINAILLRIEVAGRIINKTWLGSSSTLTSKHHTFTWDGLDEFGRKVQGKQAVRVGVGYRYPVVYKEAERFGYNGNGIPITTNVTRTTVVLWKLWDGAIGGWDEKARGLGGWSLSPQHVYAGGPRMLLSGDGTIRSASTIHGIIETVAGNGSNCTGGLCGDGGPATEATIGFPYGIDVGPDGSLFIADGNNGRVRRVGPDGIIQTVAGGGSINGDGIPATEARIFAPHDVAVQSDGSFYVTSQSHCIRYVDLDGIIHTIAGLCGTSGSSGDGGPAVDARLFYPEFIDLGPDGSLYIADKGNRKIRRIAPDGIIHRVAGTGTCASWGPGNAEPMPAIQSSLGTIHGMAVGQDGSVYVSEGECTNLNPRSGVERIRPDGLMVRFAGYRQNSVGQFSGDGGPALGAGVPSPRGLAVGRDGSVYIADEDVHRVRRVNPQGIITTVAGNGGTAPEANGYQATAAGLRSPRYLAVAPSGRLYAASFYASRVRTVEIALPELSTQQSLLASDDGSELFIFNEQGRHLQTLNAFTGAVVYDFGYDRQGRLLTITDGDNNITTVEHDASGNPTAIIAPFQQRTKIGLGADGYISSITNPELEVTEMTYFSGEKEGLLETFKKARGYPSSFRWDAMGRLAKDQDAEGGYLALSRVSDDSSFTVSLETAMGRTKSFSHTELPTGDSMRVNTFPNTLQSTVLSQTNGTTTVSLPDGTEVTTVQRPDPRFGLLSPLSAVTTELPSGLTSVRAHTRSVNLSDPDDVRSLISINDTVEENTKSTTRVYDSATRTWTTTSPEGRLSYVTLDDQGRVAGAKTPGVLAMAWSYDGNGRLSSTTQGNRSHLFDYDPTTGYLAKVTNALTQETEFLRDAVGRLTKETRPDSEFTLFSYDDNGNMSSLTPPGKPAHGFSYTPVDLLSDYTPPAVAGTGVTHHKYNVDKQLEETFIPGGKSIAYSYDTAGRLETETLPDGTVMHGYDPSTGRLVSISGPYGESLSYTYDGSLVTSNGFSGTVSGFVGFEYDSDFQVTTEKVSSTDPVNFVYDNDGLIVQAGAMTVEHDPQNGQLTGTTLTNVADSYGYNDYGEVDAYHARYNTTDLYSAGYTRDDLGRILTKTETIDGQTHVFEYTYDLAGRLSEVHKDAVLVSTYLYDANGNRLSHETPSGTTSGSYDNQDRISSYGMLSFTHTPNGEVLTKTNTSTSETTIYTYNVLGALTQVDLSDGRVIEYVTDGTGRRVGKKEDGVLKQGLLYRDTLEPIAELDGSGNVVGRFVYALGRNVPEYVIRPGGTYRIVTDHLGSVRLVVNVDTGQVIQRMDYDEYGVVTFDNVASGFQRVPFGFAGGLYDPDTGIVRFGARDYDPAVGRWLSKDPLSFVAVGTNLYVYVLDDPINGIDPTGTDLLDDLGKLLKFLFPLHLLVGCQSPRDEECKRLSTRCFEECAERPSCVKSEVGAPKDCTPCCEDTLSKCLGGQGGSVDFRPCYRPDAGEGDKW